MAPYDTKALLAAATPEDRAKEAAAFVNSVKVGDLIGLQKTTLAELKTVIADKGKGNANGRAGALGALRALLSAFGTAAEAILVPFLPAAIEALADKMKPVSFEA